MVEVWPWSHSLGYRKAKPRELLRYTARQKGPVGAPPGLTTQPDEDPERPHGLRLVLRVLVVRRIDDYVAQYVVDAPHRVVVELYP